MNSHAVSMYSAFMMEGLQDNNYNDVIETWANGCYEMVSEMVQYSAFLTELVAKIEEAFPDPLEFPGVFEYEVCSPFGYWFGLHLLKFPGEAPTIAECHADLRQRVLAFFEQGVRPAQVFRIQLALDLPTTETQEQ